MYNRANACVWAILRLGRPPSSSSMPTQTFTSKKNGLYMPLRQLRRRTPAANFVEPQKRTVPNRPATVTRCPWANCAPSPAARKVSTTFSREAHGSPSALGHASQSLACRHGLGQRRAHCRPIPRKLALFSRPAVSTCRVTAWCGPWVAMPGLEVYAVCFFFESVLVLRSQSDP